MKKCPGCGRMYSDMVTVCPSCKTSLSGGAGSSAPVPPKSYTPPVQQPVQNNHYTPSSTPRPAPPVQQPVYQPAPQPTYQPAPQPQSAPVYTEDKPGFLWLALAFFIPLVGIILHFVWKNTRPEAAKAIDKAALIGFIVWFLLGQVTSRMPSEPETGAPSTGSSYSEPKSQPSQSNAPAAKESETPVLAAGNPTAYEKIFTDRGIVAPFAFLRGLDTASYAAVTSDGIINSMQFGYSGDTVVQIVSTEYVSVEGLSDADKAALDQAVREVYAEIEKLSFVSVSYNMGYSYYSVAMTLQDLDQTANLRAASAAGALTLDNENADIISMSKMEASLLAQGFIKK